jgi:all-trans-retinol 13,14-reductase
MGIEWDTIIVGAGVGGLTAAAGLVKAGLRVLVLERNPHPGGTAYVYSRKGFAFPMGPLGFSHPELVRSILKDIGVEDDLPLHRVHYRINAFQCDVPLSLRSGAMVKELGECFPSDAQAVGRFFQDMESLLSFSKQPDSGTALFEDSAADYLRQHIKDWRLRRILGSLGTREPYSSLPLLASQWGLMVNQGIWYPEAGMGNFCERLARTVTGHQAGDGIPDRGIQPSIRKGGIGEIKLGADVAKIRVSQGRVLGVTLRDGAEMDSASVISNADYKTTFITLLDQEEVPPRWYRAVSHAKQTGSVLQVCLGVDAGKAGLSAFREASRLIYKRNQPHVQEKDDLDWTGAEMDPETLARQELEVSLWSKDDKTLAPEGKEVIVIRTEADYSHFARYRLGWRKRSPTYVDYKNRLGRALIKEAQNLIPGLEIAISVMDVATPLTFEDQGGRSGGAVAGWSWDYENFHDVSPRELIRTPVRGLYMAGYQAYSALFLGGIPTAMESGRRAAHAVLTNVGPVEEIMIPGVE